MKKSAGMTRAVRFGYPVREEPSAIFEEFLFQVVQKSLFLLLFVCILFGLSRALFPESFWP